MMRLTKFFRMHGTRTYSLSDNYPLYINSCKNAPITFAVESNRLIGGHKALVVNAYIYGHI